VAFYNLANPASPVSLCNYLDSSTYYTGMSVSVTMVSGAVYAFFGSPYKGNGQVGISYMASPSASACPVSTYSGYSGTTKYVGQTVAIMPGVLLGAASGSYSSTSDPCVISIVTMASGSGAITVGTSWTAPYSCTMLYLFVYLCILLSSSRNMDFPGLFRFTCLPRRRPVPGLLERRRCHRLFLHHDHLLLLQSSYHHHR